jgi:hypothetical protein
MIAIFIMLFFVSSWFRPFVYLCDQLARFGSAKCVVCSAVGFFGIDAIATR